MGGDLFKLLVIVAIVTFGVAWLFVCSSRKPIDKSYLIMTGNLIVECNQLKGSYLTECCVDGKEVEEIINPTNVFVLKKSFVQCNK